MLQYGGNDSPSPDKITRRTKNENRRLIVIYEENNTYLTSMNYVEKSKKF